MTFQKYQTGNNVVGFLDAWLSASWTTMIMKSEYAELFPTHAGGATKDYLLTLEQIDTVTKAVLKREIVKVKGRAWNIFTIERWAWTCPWSDTATEQGNNAYPFSSGDKVILSITAENDKDIKDELERLEAGKKDNFDFADISISDLKDWPSETPANNEYLKWNEAAQRYEPWVVEATDIPEVTALANNDYLAGEDITKWDILFAETWPTFAEATNVANIGDTSANTRYTRYDVSSWIYASTFKAGLKKFTSPSVNLNCRLQAWDWTDYVDVDAVNAIATIAPWSLTTSVADTTMTWAGTFTAPVRWTKIRYVFYAGTYGSETINATNYYGIAYSTKDTTTRGRALRNWITRSATATNINTYISSALSEPILLSKTDADYTYKLPDIPRIAKDNYAIGELVRYDFAWIIWTESEFAKNENIYMNSKIWYWLFWWEVNLINHTTGSNNTQSKSYYIKISWPANKSIKSVTILARWYASDWYFNFFFSWWLYQNNNWVLGALISSIPNTIIPIWATSQYVTYTFPSEIPITYWETYRLSLSISAQKIWWSMNVFGYVYWVIWANSNKTITYNTSYVLDTPIWFRLNTNNTYTTETGIQQYAIGNVIDNSWKIKLYWKKVLVPITVWTSPFTRQNITGNSVQIEVAGGTVNPIQISKDNTTWYTVATATWYMGILAPWDYVKITYTAAPTLKYSEL